MPHRSSALRAAVGLTGLWLGLSSTPAAESYIRVVPSESSRQREERHAAIAQRRDGPLLIAHRGACTLARENTLEAYAAAMDYGADGCEIDIRRTADGILVLFHDDMLDHLTDGFGKLEEITYAELLALKPQPILGVKAGNVSRPPTLAALLGLARQRTMLLHLDVKEQGIDAQVVQMLDETDMWDHVIAVNTQTCSNLLAHPRLKLVETFHRVNPALIEVRNPLYTNQPLSWVDWRKASIISVLGQLRCAEARKFLLEYVALSDSEAWKLSIPRFEEATRALLLHRITPAELQGLLQNTNTAVRGTAILACIDNPTSNRIKVLRAEAPWALQLPRYHVARGR